jgi:hypothetical protein
MFRQRRTLPEQLSLQVMKADAFHILHQEKRRKTVQTGQLSEDYLWNRHGNTDHAQQVNLLLTQRCIVLIDANYNPADSRVQTHFEICVAEARG